MKSKVVVGTAGWSLPRLVAASFPGDGTQLTRYARVFAGVEIDTSAYRDHSAETYAGWAQQTPRRFRFAVKLPQRITHEQRLRAARRPLDAFFETVGGLGSRLGPLVIQLPPSLSFERRVARTFFTLLRDRHEGAVCCEPRHPSWFEPPADDVLIAHRIARVAADPAIVPAAAVPGGWSGLVYYRLHGSPRKYWSVYDDQRVDAWTEALVPRSAKPAWCVFDNTAGGGAAGNALRMNAALQPDRSRR